MVSYENFYGSIAVNHENTKGAKKLLKLASEEVIKVQMCSQCYINGDDFTMVCKEPHFIVWAYKRYGRYWPAKVMSIDGHQINIRFFGTHAHGIVQANKCFLYSRKSPRKKQHFKSNEQMDNEIKSAIKVIFLQSR